jgi:hypothetical protein
MKIIEKKQQYSASSAIDYRERERVFKERKEEMLIKIGYEKVNVIWNMSYYL